MRAVGNPPPYLSVKVFYLDKLGPDLAHASPDFLVRVAELLKQILHGRRLRAGQRRDPAADKVARGRFEFLR